ncbi:SusD/RagB family nutrient-binding outer membrane lipoprotein [Pedobacter sp. L105]|uniref:SusD/RagB family nutrient-binding outer membrane lipoprotein n=1 Tax=Pedobacter sp. L105 TaxID=1641871 RepID=UPI00131C61C7|nr:SusD/RagB family nutrient-binding outer membrane lipoprotein [Pedobacter sp. L105]
MKKIITAALSILLLGACKKDITSLNVNPKTPTTVPAASLFTQAQHTLANTLTSANVNLNNFRLVEQMWQETTYTDESNYNFITRPIPDNDWNAFYRDILYNLKLAKGIIPTDISITDAKVKANDIAIADIMQVYTYYYVLTTFGNAPYTDALDPTNLFPKYDDAATVYADLLKKLDADVASMTATSASYGAADIIYSGDVPSWIKFANTLKLKMGITIADSDPATAKTVITAAVTAGVFASNDDNAKFTYLGATPNTNPVWVDLVQSGRNDFVACTTYTTNLLSYTDPRLPLFFTTDAAGSYSGGIPGASSDFNTFSHPSAKIEAADFPGLLLDYSETAFNLAEATERGFIATGTSAATYYNDAVTASIIYWGGTATQATTYLAQPTVNYATAAGTYKQKIGTQKWFALYNRGWDAWIETRRLDYPVLVAPPTALTVFPERLRYPAAEQNINGANYATASAAIGGDVPGTKLFFDKF